MIKDFKDKTQKIHDTAFVHETCTVIGDVELKEHASLWPGCVARGDEGKIVVGKNSNIQDNSVIHCDDQIGGDTFVGDNVSCGHRVILHATRIESNCLIGMGAILLSGSKIGANSIIGAGAVVRENQEIPANSLAVGVPARVIREVTSEEVERIKHNWEHYVELKNVYKGKY